MRRFLSIVASLVVLSVVAGAQHYKMNEQAVKVDLTVDNDVMVGTTRLAAGKYKVACDRDWITFTRRDTKQKVLIVLCHGRELPEASKVTKMRVKTDRSGRLVIDTLLLKGSRVEHVFEDRDVP